MFPTQFRVIRVIVGVLILNKGGSAGYLYRASLGSFMDLVCVGSCSNRQWGNQILILLHGMGEGLATMAKDTKFLIE